MKLPPFNASPPNPATHSGPLPLYEHGHSQLYQEHTIQWCYGSAELLLCFSPSKHRQHRSTRHIRWSLPECARLAKTAPRELPPCRFHLPNMKYILRIKHTRITSPSAGLIDRLQIFVLFHFYHACPQNPTPTKTTKSYIGKFSAVVGVDRVLQISRTTLVVYLDSYR